MIYCIDFEELHLHLVSMGFVEVGQTELLRAYQASDGRRFSIRPPNEHGYLPEIIVDDAFASAGLNAPRWRVFWSD